MAAPGDPLYFTIWDDLVSRLGGMRRGEGYHLDYGSVLAGARSYGIQDSDFARPKVGLRWLGELSEDPVTGGDRSASFTRRFPQFEVTVPARQGRGGSDDDTKRAFRILADVHKATMDGSTVRARGLNGCATWESEVRWLDNDEGGDPSGGTLLLIYTVRFNHATGDLSSVNG